MSDVQPVAKWVIKGDGREVICLEMYPLWDGYWACRVESGMESYQDGAVFDDEREALILADRIVSERMEADRTALTSLRARLALMDRT